MAPVPKNRIPAHPGELLYRLYLEPLELTQVDLAEHLGISVQRVNEIVNGRRGITPETAWLFSQAFGTTPQFWLNAQAQHDLALSKPNRSVPLLVSG